MTRDDKAYLVYQFSFVWKLTPAAYRRMLLAGATGKTFDMDKMRGCKRIGDIDASQVVDWEEEDFQDRLKQLNSPKA